MAQNISLSNRVRFLPTTKKKDLPPMFDCNFVGTTIMASQTSYIPQNVDEWQMGSFNFNDVIGSDGSGTISALDQFIWNLGISGEPLLVINPSVNNQYPLSYNESTLPSGSHSGFIFYTVYDVEAVTVSAVDGGSKIIYKMCVDIWESRVMINNATSYGQIN